MLAAVPGCGMCVSAFERGFEPSSSKLMWGEVKHNPAAGPAPHETADPVLNESQPFEVERVLPRPCWGLRWNAAEPEFYWWGLLQGSSSVTAGFFWGGCAAPLLQLACVWLQSGCPATSPLPPPLCSDWSQPSDCLCQRMPAAFWHRGRANCLIAGFSVQGAHSTQC